jgi:hypothetical protein
MKLLHTFNEENVSEQEALAYKTRKAVRAVVVDAEGNIVFFERLEIDESF